MTTPTFPLMWLTSGTPIRDGQTHCAMSRYLGNHAGRHGTGFRRRSTAVPLATGSGTHRGMELIGGWILEWQGANVGRRLLPGDLPDEVIAWGAATAAAEYAEKATTRGLDLTKTDVDTVAATQQLITEQKTLIEAQVWIYCLGRLPIMLADYRLLDVEREEAPVVDCTCGLCDWVGQADVHAARGCAGIVLQGRADFLWEHATTGQIVYEEFKTKATPNYGWENAWEHSGQLLLNMHAASMRLGREVTEAFVPVLFKGKRDRVDRDDKFSPKIQQSPLVYGWFDPGNGMGREAEWAARYKWVDDWGKWHTLGRSFKRTMFADMTSALPTANPNGVTVRAGASRVEQWVKGWILPAMYPELLKVLGPFPKPRARVPVAVQGLLASERRWREDVALLRAMGVYDTLTVGQSTTPEGQQQAIMAADLIDRSWQCTGFDGTPCQFKPVCFGDPGSEAGIENMPEFEIRTPHHSTERAACEGHVAALGLKFEASEEDGDGSD